ncbi:hypothetical protein RU639_013567 [Aspergillus parasiticus]
MNPDAVERYSVHDILTISSIHPFYNSKIRFPPTDAQIKETIGGSRAKEPSTLNSFPLTHKHDLYQIIQRLIAEDDPKNVFRHASYISTTGGGSGGVPMVYFTDAWENRMQRFSAAKLFKTCGIIEPGDCILTMHASGNLYRSLDLTAELVENAGGTVFPAGHLMSQADVIDLLSAFRINVISGDSSQVLQLAMYVSTLPETQRKSVSINKVLYTSEPLVQSQRAYIKSVFGDVLICSAFGSAEAGPWAVMNPTLTGDGDDDTADFIFDTRNILVEVFPPAAAERASNVSQQGILKPLADGEVGVIVLTSLQRLRNPLVRYVSGDVGSLHPMPKTDAIDSKEAQHLKTLRLHGRDQRFSFNWQGEYFDFQAVRHLIQSEEFCVLQWQIILKSEASHTHSLEVRILRRQSPDKSLSDMDVDMVRKLRKFFHVVSDTEPYFSIKFLGDLQGFERSSTGNKVIRFIDMRGH